MSGGHHSSMEQPSHTHSSSYRPRRDEYREEASSSRDSKYNDSSASSPRHNGSSSRYDEVEDRHRDSTSRYRETDYRRSNEHYSMSHQHSQQHTDGGGRRRWDYDDRERDRSGDGARYRSHRDSHGDDYRIRERGGSHRDHFRRETSHDRRASSEDGSQLEDKSTVQTSVDDTKDDPSTRVKQFRSPMTQPQVKTEKDTSVDPSPVASGSASPQKPTFKVDQEELPTRISRRARPKGPTSTAQLVDHLPRADEAAFKTFEPMEASSYGKLGKSRTQDQGIQCECRYRPGKDNIDMACSDSAGCINRLTQIECLESECHCRHHCQNQRFQKREYATVEIVQTEKKGFGLRAGAPLTPDQFIYEYLGEVIGQEVFYKRMQKYKDEGIRHFYFMMLQREEYVDATKKGGVGRFLNHSCNPNCYVAKWQVGKHFRMGIFAKRDIVQGEELTFNYNVDRYGNDAQECFCGEPNCQGTIGGKTQTDIGGMDDLFIDALGIRDEVEAQDARGTKKKKSLHLDKDFNPQLRPMEDEDVAQVMTAIRQATSNRRILSKLLSRIHMTDQVDVQKLAVRLHGFVLMSTVLDEWKDDKEIVVLALGSLARWPLIARNKVVDSGIDQQVKSLAENSDVEIFNLATGLLSAWEALEVSYRIARRDDDDDDTEALAASVWDSVPGADPYDDPGAVSLDNAQAPNAVSEQLSRIVPLGTAAPAAPAGASSSRPTLRFSLNGSRSATDDTSASSPQTPRDGDSRTSSSVNVLNATLARLQHMSPTTPTAVTPVKKSLEEIIREATEKAEKDRQLALEAAEAAKQKEADEKARKAAGGSRKHGRSEGGNSSRKDREKRRKSEKSSSSASGPPLDAAALDKRLEKLMGEVVVVCMSKYKEHFDRDSFKKYAKELTTVLCAKEKKKAWPPPDGRIPTFSSDKRTKIKAFAKEYIKKIIDRRRKKAAASKGGAGGSGAHRSERSKASTSISAKPDAPASNEAPAPAPNGVLVSEEKEGGGADKEDDDEDTDMDASAESEIDLESESVHSLSDSEIELDDVSEVPPLVLPTLPDSN